MTFRICLALLIGVAGRGSLLADLNSAKAPTEDQSLTPAEEGRAAGNAHYLAARALEGEGKMRAALEHYVAFLKAGAEPRELVFHIAELSLNYHGLDETIALLDAVAKANTTDPGPALNLALFALTHADEKEGLKERAVAICNEQLAKFPRDASVYESAVRAQLILGKHDAAASALDQAMKQDVSDPDFWLRIGRAALEVWPLADTEKRSTHLAKVNPIYDRALIRALSSQNAETQLQIADYYLFSNQLEKASAVCETMAKRDNNLDAQKRLVRLYEAMDRQADSLKALEALVKSHPADVEHHRLLASEYIKNRDITQAVEQLEAALQAGGGDLNDYLQISNLLRFTEQPDKLDRFTVRAMRLYPGEPRVAFYRALALNELKKFSEAASLFAKTADQAETMAPELLDDRFHFSWGVSLERSGNFDEAARQFDKSIQLTPPDDLMRAANTMNYLGYMWVERGQNYDKAEQLILKANELSRNNPAFIDSLGWLYMKQGKPEEALTELLKAESLMEKITREDAEILDHIAQTYDRLGNQDKAKQYWKRTLDLDPDVKAIRDRAEKALGMEKPLPKAAPQPEKE